MRPIGQKVLVLQDEPPTQVGLIILNAAMLQKPNTGKVVAIGQDNAFVKIAVEAGQRVAFNPGHAQKFDHDGIEHLIINYEGILAEI